jgi:hypothetical protein
MKKLWRELCVGLNFDTFLLSPPPPSSLCVHQEEVTGQPRIATSGTIENRSARLEPQQKLRKQMIKKKLKKKEEGNTHEKKPT